MKAKLQELWSDEEVAILRSIYPTSMRMREMMVRLPGRSDNQIRCQARHLGLSRRAPVGSQPPLTLTDAQAGYLAGLIDGEGTITLKTQTVAARRNQLQIIPAVWVFNTNTDVLEWVKSVTPFVSHVRARSNPTAGARRIHEWRVIRIEDVARTLVTILPHLIIKRRQAELVLEFCENRIPYSEYTEREVAILAEVRSLNRRGITA